MIECVCCLWQHCTSKGGWNHNLVVLGSSTLPCHTGFVLGYKFNSSGQNVSCVHIVVLHFAELTVDFFFFYENLLLMPSFFLNYCHSFDQLVTGLCVFQFCLQSYLWLTNQTPSHPIKCISLVWLQTKMDSTQSYHHFKFLLSTLPSQLHTF